MTQYRKLFLRTEACVWVPGCANQQRADTELSRPGLPILRPQEILPALPPRLAPYPQQKSPSCLAYSTADSRNVNKRCVASNRTRTPSGSVKFSPPCPAGKPKPIGYAYSAKMSSITDNSVAGSSEFSKHPGISP